MKVKFVIFAVISALPLFSTDVYIPSFPSIATALGVSQWQVQSTLSIYLLGLGLAQIFYGPFSDRFGRLPVLLCGMFLFSLSTLGCALAPDIFWLRQFRLLQAIGSCSGLVLGRAMIGDSYSREESAKILSIIYPLIALSPLIAPVLGGFINFYFGWRAVFALLFVVSVLSFFGILFFLKETKLKLDQEALYLRSILTKFYYLGRDGRFIAYTVTIMAAYAAYFAYLSEAPFIFDKLGFGSNLGGFLYSPTAASYIVGTMIGRRILKTRPLEAVIRTGCIIFVVGAMAMLLSVGLGVNHAWQIILPMCVVTTGNGMILSFSMAGALAVSPALAGVASGLVGSLQLGAASASTVMLGTLFERSIASLSIFIGVVTLIGLISFVRQFGLRQRPSADFPN